MVNKAAAKLRAQLAEQDKVIVCPGVQDGLSARVCLDEGFENLYMVSVHHYSQNINFLKKRKILTIWVLEQTGAGTAISVLGLPDLGLTTVDDMVRNAGMIASLDRNVPVIADADTGYGGPLSVARTVSFSPVHCLGEAACNFLDCSSFRFYFEIGPILTESAFTHRSSATFKPVSPAST